MSSQPMHRHAGINVICAAGAVVIHALLLSPMVLGTGGHKKPRSGDTPGPGASAIVSSAEYLTLVLISESQPMSSHELDLADLASRGIVRNDQAVRILSPDPNPAFDAAAEEDLEQTSQSADQSTGDARERAELFERYLRQVYSRIERAWIQPARFHVDGDEAFDCSVRILQDANGKVREIMLIECDDGIDWQQSLVAAIQQASPLPAPPHPSVFTSALMLQLQGRPRAAVGVAQINTNNVN